MDRTARAEPGDEPRSHGDASDDRGRPERRRRALTDGGCPASTDEDAQRERLQSLFVDVTGGETLVEEQQRDGSTRFVGVADERTAGALSEYVTEMLRDDGLSEAFGDPDPDETTQ